MQSYYDINHIPKKRDHIKSIYLSRYIKKNTYVKLDRHCENRGYK